MSECSERMNTETQIDGLEWCEFYPIANEPCSNNARYIGHFTDANGQKDLLAVCGVCKLRAEQYWREILGFTDIFFTPIAALESQVPQGAIVMMPERLWEVVNVVLRASLSRYETCDPCPCKPTCKRMQYCKRELSDWLITTLTAESEARESAQGEGVDETS
jgi:hypothetical protein